MPLYRFEMKSADGSESRRGRILLPSKELVVATLEERELEYVSYELPAEEVDEIKAKEKTEQKLTQALKAHSVMHTQDKPYKLVKVEEVK